MTPPTSSADSVVDMGESKAMHWPAHVGILSGHVVLGYLPFFLFVYEDLRFLGFGSTDILWE